MRDEALVANDDAGDVSGAPVVADTPRVPEQPAFDARRTHFKVLDKVTGQTVHYGSAAAGDLAAATLPDGQALIVVDAADAGPGDPDPETSGWKTWDRSTSPVHVRVDGEMAIQRQLRRDKMQPFLSRAKGKPNRYLVDESLLVRAAQGGGLLKMADGTLVQHSAAEAKVVLGDYIAVQDALDLAAQDQHKALLASVERLKEELAGAAGVGAPGAARGKLA